MSWAKQWAVGAARRSLVGRESTANPLPAAQRLLAGARRRVRRTTLHSAGRARRYFRVARLRTANPLPAAVATLAKSAIARKLGGILGVRRDTTGDRAAEAARLEAAARAGDQEAVGALFYRIEVNHFQDPKHGYAPALARLIADGILDADTRQLVKKVRKKTTGESISEAVSDVGEFAQTKGGLEVIRALAGTGRRAATSRLRTVGYDEFGQPIRRRVKSGARGVGRAAGLKVPPALMKAGVAVGGLAAGYWVGTKLQQHIAGRALSKEEAGVAAALAFRQARADAAEAKGAPLSRTELKSLGDAYKAQLVALGYDPVTFTRKRSAVERFVSDFEEE